MTDMLKKIQCFLFDMDGTIYLGDKLLPGAKDFLNVLDERRIPYYFLTNNSSRSRSDYVKKLEKLGLQTPPDKIFSSGEATAIYLKKQGNGSRVFLVGTPSLERSRLALFHFLFVAAYQIIAQLPDFLGAL